MKFRLADGYTRAATAAFGVVEAVVIEAGDVFESDEPAVLDALRALGPAVEEVTTADKAEKGKE